MEIRPTGGALGAEILGIDPRSATESEVEHIYQALLEHEVVFLRNTQLDDAGHLKFAGRFGTPSVFPMFKVLGETKPTFQVIHDGPDSAPVADASGRGAASAVSRKRTDTDADAAEILPPMVLCLVPNSPTCCPAKEDFPY